MRHKRTNPNKQFLIGNIILAIGILSVVFIFLFWALQAQKEKGTLHNEYMIAFSPTFINDSISVYLNDSMLLSRTIHQEETIRIAGFAPENTLFIVDHHSDELTPFNLRTGGGHFIRIDRKGKDIHIYEETPKEK